MYKCSKNLFITFGVVFSACGLPIPTVVGKGLNLCILDMFDHTCSGLKKSKFLWAFRIWFNESTVFRKGLNLCIFYIFDHTCSGLKKSKFLCTNSLQEFVHYFVCTFCMWFTIPTVVWKRSKFVYF